MTLLGPRFVSELWQLDDLLAASPFNTHSLGSFLTHEQVEEDDNNLRTFLLRAADRKQTAEQLKKGGRTLMLAV